MNLGFRDADVQQLFNERRRLVARFGDRSAQVIACRMLVLQAAPTLSVLPRDPPVNLQPTGRADVFTVDLDGGRRLRLAAVAHASDRQGGRHWRDVTDIDILGVEV